MNINVVRLSNRGYDDNFLKKLNQQLKKNNIVLKENIEKSIMTFILVESGGVENIFKDVIKKNILPPYYFIVTNRNNSLAATLEIATYLKQKDIAHRIFVHDDFAILSQEIVELVYVKNAYYKVCNTRLGVIGEPSDWLIGSEVNYGKVYNKFHIGLLDIQIDELLDLYQSKRHIVTYPDNYEELKNVYGSSSLDELENAIKLYSCLKTLIKKYDLKGLTIRCFDIVNIKKVTACLALALLNDEGYVCSCEGDIPSLLTMYLLRILLKQPSFMANPSYIDFKENCMIFAHCTIPLKMCTSFKFMTHFETDESIGVKGELHEGNINICKLTPDLGELDIVCGRIDKNLSLPNFCRTQIQVSLLDKTIDEFINMHHANHVIITYGNHQHLIEQFFKEF